MDNIKMLFKYLCQEKRMLWLIVQAPLPFTQSQNNFNQNNLIQKVIFTAWNGGDQKAVIRKISGREVWLCMCIRVYIQAFPFQPVTSDFRCLWRAQSPVN